MQSNWNEITDNFDDMNLKETLLRGIYAYGFEKPSAIQQRAIIPCIKGINVFIGGGSFFYGEFQANHFDPIQGTMSLLKPSQALAKRPRLPSPSCSSWRLSRKRPRLWSWRRPVSLLSRYAVPEVMINLRVSQTKAAYLGLNPRYNFALLPAL